VQEIIAEDKTSLGLAFSKDQINVACPWHGYEFDIQTGQHQGNPRVRLRPVKIEIVDGVVVVTMPEGVRERIARARSKRAEPYPP
jgi:nitrite reductase/ring-hydroxylating ferredoxin subunit